MRTTYYLGKFFGSEHSRKSLYKRHRELTTDLNCSPPVIKAKQTLARATLPKEESSPEAQSRPM